MIRYIILEDEPAALKRLTKLIKQLRPSWVLKGSADSIETSKALISQEHYDLILSDIELSDGNCFEVFQNFSELKPIIFITAFNDFALKAFDFNSIHYLLKPMKPEQLEQALSKFENSQTGFHIANSSLIKNAKEDLQRKLISKLGGTTAVIDYNDIAYVVYTQKLTKSYMKNNEVHYFDHSLDKLMDYLPNQTFYRINRQTILNRDIIKGYQTISSNRLLLSTDPVSEVELIVSKEKTPIFKKWIKT